MKFWRAGLIAVSITTVLACGLSEVNARKGAVDSTIGNADIAGSVASSKGPEAGVWVIAETKDLPTKFVKIVVTDDQGRYLIPELPKATYKVWVRGYGLQDSHPIENTPGKTLNLTAQLAPDPHTAAQYYPGEYWYSLLKLPAETEFPGTGSNGISTKTISRGQWVEMIKTDGCEACHQMGDKATRELPSNLGHFDSSVKAWARRISSAQVGAQMVTRVQSFGGQRALELFADWTDRIAKGEYPTDVPTRPQGIERNVVITEWDWGTAKEYFHDEISTDRQNPTLNAHGPIYGVHEVSTDSITILDPERNSMSEVPVPVRDSDTPFAAPQAMLAPSPYWGEEPIWSSKANAHSLMMDQEGRIWVAATIRASHNPGFCKEGSKNPSAVVFPLDSSGIRQATVFDPRTKTFQLIDICFGSQHLNFAEDANKTLWFSNPEGGDAIGWLNTKLYDETHDDDKSQGWTPLIMDTNGNGKRDAYNEPDQPLDPTKDKRFKAGFYGINPSPVDGSVWGSVLGYPGSIVRIVPGPNPPVTALAERFEPPLKDPKDPRKGYQGFSPRGMDVDRNGVVWTVLASGHLASFERRKCKGPLNGPTAIGQQCPEGWTLYRVPGPTFAGTDVTVDSNYYDWVDQFDAFGLGKNVPIATGDGSDSLLALSPTTGKFTVLRVPYPMGFYAKSLDGRIDDPNTGWKGRALWSTYATRAPQHIEGGKGTLSKVVKFQLRPNPLAN